MPEETEAPVAWCCQRWPSTGPVLLVVDDVQDYAVGAQAVSGEVSDGSVSRDDD